MNRKYKNYQGKKIEKNQVFQLLNVNIKSGI